MDSVVISTRDIAQFLIILSLSFCALRFAKGPERLCVLVLIMMKLVDLAFHAAAGQSGVLPDLEVGHLLIDIAAAVAFVAIMLQANRLYPIWLSSIQLISVMGHFAQYLGKSAQKPYAVMAIAPSYLLVVVIGLGILAEHRRQRQGQTCRAWRKEGRSQEPSIMPPT